METNTFLDRSSVAEEAGYADAKFMRHMHETHGFSVADSVLFLRSKAPQLKIPWLGLRSEFLSIGMKESAVDSMLNEAREFAR